MTVTKYSPDEWNWALGSVVWQSPGLSEPHDSRGEGKHTESRLGLHEL